MAAISGLNHFCGRNIVPTAYIQDVILWYADRLYLCVNRTFWYRYSLTALPNVCVERDYLYNAIKTVVYRENTGQDVKLDFVNISNVKDETAMFPCQWIS